MGSIVFSIIAFLIFGLAWFLLRKGDAFLKRISKVAACAALLVPAAVFTFGAIRTVSPGHVGVVTIFGSVQDGALAEGLHFVNPVSKVEEMSVQVRKYEGQYAAATSDMQNVSVGMTINYALDPAKAHEVYQKIGVNYVATIVTPAAKEILKAEAARYKASEILDQRQKIKASVQEALDGWIMSYGILLREISISNVAFDDQYAAAIEQKQIQEQRAEEEEYKLQATRKQAEIAAAKAKGEADAVREAAQGKADALRIEGDAQAEYNRRVAESLTPVLIQSEYLKRWDGKLPHFMSGKDGGFLFQVQTEK